MKGRPIKSREDVIANIMSRAIQTEAGCLELSGSLNSKGYPCIGVSGKKVELAHRFVWEHHNGPIAEGKQVHHKCENKRCCEISHLAELTQSEHAKEHRPTHCAKGHEFTDENSKWHKKGTRQCRLCAKEYHLAYMRRHREAAKRT